MKKIFWYTLFLPTCFCFLNAFSHEPWQWHFVSKPIHFKSLMGSKNHPPQLPLSLSFGKSFFEYQIFLNEFTKVLSFFYKGFALSRPMWLWSHHCLRLSTSLALVIKGDEWACEFLCAHGKWWSWTWNVGSMRCGSRLQEMIVNDRYVVIHDARGDEVGVGQGEGDE